MTDDKILDNRQRAPDKMLELDEFRIQTYSERHVLQVALDLYRARGYKMFDHEAEALIKRISHTKCSERGCSYCDPNYDPSWDGKD